MVYVTSVMLIGSMRYSALLLITEPTSIHPIHVETPNAQSVNLTSDNPGRRRDRVNQANRPNGGMHNSA